MLTDQLGPFLVPPTGAGRTLSSSEPSWTGFTSERCAITRLVCLQSLVSCLGGAFLGGVIARMSKDYRHCRAGLPDLVVWNTSEHTYKVRSQVTGHGKGV